MKLDAPGTRRSVDLSGLSASLSQSPLRSKRFVMMPRVTLWLVVFVAFVAGLFGGACAFGLILLPPRL